ncbi:SnoaL-like domain-containing protein [Spirosoma sp. KUDC1026]|uniref:SnoaL-like domain-containing protein n=1 Tax=Spirosoma sp. KUDC1026 TaxID=2745947 RepID=UPI00159BE3D1|nr:SnoaL-like domain-containing protein [Spirosoma sp. KUDC1026]QKZ11587.1 nuclear transport factor 2 family protein [Spirosoma sp. KUDC1026]
MTTLFVAHRLVALCREGLFLDAQLELMADTCVQLEPVTSIAENVSGLKAIQQKERRLQANIQELHSIIVSEPTIVGAFFSVTMHFDLTLYDRGRVQLEELVVYEVRQGKIVREQFFY